MIYVFVMLAFVLVFLVLFYKFLNPKEKHYNVQACVGEGCERKLDCIRYIGKCNGPSVNLKKRCYDWRKKSLFFGG